MSYGRKNESIRGELSACVYVPVFLPVCATYHEIPLILTAHEAGLVTLQMVCEGQIISNTVVFEYRARNALSLPATQHDWLSLDGISHDDFCITLMSPIHFLSFFLSFILSLSLFSFSFTSFSYSPSPLLSFSHLIFLHSLFLFSFPPSIISLSPLLPLSLLPLLSVTNTMSFTNISHRFTSFFDFEKNIVDPCIVIMNV